MNAQFPVIPLPERKARLDIPAGRIRLVIDTDTKNEVDDQFAISWALRSPDRFRVEAVYAAPFSQDCFGRFLQGGFSSGGAGTHYAKKPGDGMEASFQEILKLFDLLGEPSEGRVFRGSEAYLSDQNQPVDSPAARDLIRRAMDSSETLYVAAIGAPTNVASALLMEPRIAEKIVVIWLGGQPLDFPHGIEFNLMQDVRASQVLFDSGVPLVYIPCMNVASCLTLSKPEVEAYMVGKSRISDYLAQNVLDAFGDVKAAAMGTMFFRKMYLKDREDRQESYLAQFPTNHVAWSRIIWDISTIAFLKNPGWTPSTLLPSPVLRDDLYWGKPDASRHPIRVVNYCYRDLIFGDMFACLTQE